MDLRLPATEAPPLPAITEPERLGDAYGVVGLDARRQAVSLFREALDRLGAVTNAALAEQRPGPVRVGGLVVTRQHPMTARGTVFLALEDETGMVNVTLWPDTWQRLRSVIRRHALLLVDGDLQREANVVNVIARSVTPLVEAASVGGPGHRRRAPDRARGHAPDGLGGRHARVRAALPRPFAAGFAGLPRFGLARLRNRLYQADAEAKNIAPSGETIQAWRCRPGRSRR